jgi:hypothetical protein
VGSAALYPTRCWFKTNVTGCGPCEGPLQRAHLIRAQVISREVSDAFEILWDPRVWVPGCVRHHRMLDHSRQIRLARSQVPVAVEEFALEFPDVAFWLDREYGAREIEGGWSTPGHVSAEFGGCVE